MDWKTNIDRSSFQEFLDMFPDFIYFQLTFEVAALLEAIVNTVRYILVLLCLEPKQQRSSGGAC